jgi:enoyl-CoA hydratase
MPDKIVSASDGALRIAVEGAAALVTLDRLNVRNALTVAMRAEVARGLPRFARDPQVYALILRSAGAGVFSAGADLREIVTFVQSCPVEAYRAAEAECRLAWQLECFTKPTVALIDGLIMGAGVGLTMYGTHRIAGEGYRFAMSGAKMGLFSDNGMACTFARMPHEIGMYLALTGRQIGRADAYWLGLATHCIPACRFDEIIAALRQAEPVDPILDSRHEDPGPAELAAFAPIIARCFSGATILEILHRLELESSANAAWAKTVAAEIRMNAPLSLAVTHRHVRAARTLDLRQTLMLDYRLARRFLASADFVEGARVALSDYDQTPVWRPSKLEDLTDAMIDSHFAALGAEDLTLPTRDELQGKRG